MQKLIKLFQSETGDWMADFVNDTEIMDLFKTTILPTPYFGSADKAHILKTIKLCNPEHEVIFA